MADIDILGIGKAASSLTEPLKDFLGTLLGPAANEAGQLFGDKVRYLRWKNSLTIIERADNELRRRGIKPSTVPLKTLIPILEGASLESEDENLQSKWANLLINATQGSSVHPSYPKILSELVQSEARILDHLYELDIKRSYSRQKIQSIQELDRKIKNELYQAGISLESPEYKPYKRQLDELYLARSAEYKNRAALRKRFVLKEICNELDIEWNEIVSFIDNLKRLEVCKHPETTQTFTFVKEAALNEQENHKTKEPEYEIELETEDIVERDVDEGSIFLTELGRRFMEACNSKENKSS
ncbi:MAG: hypothetical protein RLZZ597_895 [Cyanobacteriota bacterium]|jgi:hypothetical protein